MIELILEKEEKLKMKKLTLLFALVLLAACGSSSTATKTGEATITDSKGEKTTAKVTLEGDKIKSVTLDATKDGKSKKELKDSYGMKANSSIGKEWYEQAEALEKLIVEKGVDNIHVNDEGKPTDADVLTGTTVTIKDLLEATKEAVKNAK